MNTIVAMKTRRPELLDVVTLVTSHSDYGLPRGAVGTVVEPLDDSTSLVEFSGDDGQARAIVACRHHELRVVADANR